MFGCSLVVPSEAQGRGSSRYLAAFQRSVVDTEVIQ